MRCNLRKCAISRHQKLINPYMVKSVIKCKLFPNVRIVFKTKFDRCKSSMFMLNTILPYKIGSYLSPWK